MRKPCHQILVTAMCALAIFGAQPALAQYSTGSEEASAQRVLDEINTFLDKANTAIDEGEAAESAGHYTTACEAYRRAIAYNESAISAHMGYSANEAVSYRKISDSIDNIRRHTDNIESSAGRVCGKQDAEPVYSDRPAPAVQEQDAATNETRRLYREFYLPVVTLWAPYIETPVAESDLVALKVDLLGGRCADQWIDVKKAEIRSALSAVELCLAMKYWLSDNPASTCLYLAEDPDYVRDNPDDDPEMARAYDEAGMPAIKDRLRKAAACQSKTPADWNAYSIAMFNSYPSYAHAVPFPAARQYYHECFFANKLAQKGNYDAAVSTAVQNACDSAYPASDDDTYSSADVACNDLAEGKAALDALLAQRTDAPGTSEAPKIYATIARLQGDLGCASGSPELRNGGPPVTFSHPTLPGES